MAPENDRIYLMVLNDGETYTDLKGCKIVAIDGYLYGDEIDWALKYGNFTTVAEF